MNPAASRRWRIAISVLAGLLACGLPLWPIPYSRINMPGNPSMSVWFLGGACAGLIAGYLLRPGIRMPTLSVAAGFVLAVLGRVAVDTSRDPTSHDLWPFEVVIAGGIGLVAGLAGVLVARVVQRITRSG
jgi:hypothetical protein